MTIKSILFAAIALFFSASSNSALNDIDWQTSGDSLIIRDTNSGLDWLDLRVTADLSHDVVVANLEPGGAFHGFRLATQAEVLELWANAGITNNERVWVTGQFASVKDLVDRLGTTTMFEEGLFPIAKHTIGMVEGGPALAENKRWAMEITYAPDDLHHRTSANYYTWDVSVADHHYSTYLVQYVRDGDLNLDGQVNAGDVLIALKISLGLVTASTEQIEHGDVAPLTAGVPNPDGVINVADVLVIQRKVLGLASFP